jgi:hypothetical protein
MPLSAITELCSQKTNWKHHTFFARTVTAQDFQTILQFTSAWQLSIQRPRDCTAYRPTQNQNAAHAYRSSSLLCFALYGFSC